MENTSKPVFYIASEYNSVLYVSGYSESKQLIFFNEFNTDTEFNSEDKNIIPLQLETAFELIPNAFRTDLNSHFLHTELGEFYLQYNSELVAEKHIAEALIKFANQSDKIKNNCNVVAILPQHIISIGYKNGTCFFANVFAVADLQESAYFSLVAAKMQQIPDADITICYLGAKNLVEKTKEINSNYIQKQIENWIKIPAEIENNSVYILQYLYAVLCA